MRAADAADGGDLRPARPARRRRAGRGRRGQAAGRLGGRRAPQSAEKDRPSSPQLKSELAEAEAEELRASRPRLREPAGRRRARGNDPADRGRPRQPRWKRASRCAPSRSGCARSAGAPTRWPRLAAAERAARERAAVRRRQRTAQAAVASAVATGAGVAVAAAESSLAQADGAARRRRGGERGQHRDAQGGARPRHGAGRRARRGGQHRARRRDRPGRAPAAPRAARLARGRRVRHRAGGPDRRVRPRRPGPGDRRRPATGQVSRQWQWQSATAMARRPRRSADALRAVRAEAGQLEEADSARTEKPRPDSEPAAPRGAGRVTGVPYVRAEQEARAGGGRAAARQARQGEPAGA